MEKYNDELSIKDKEAFLKALVQSYEQSIPKIKVKYLNDSVERIKKFENGNWIDLRCYDAEKIIISNAIEYQCDAPYVLTRKTIKQPVQWEQGLFEKTPVEFFKYHAGDFILINLGLAMELPKGCEANIVPRSSTFKTYSFLQTNSYGVIDESYKGDKDIWFMPVLAIQSGFIIKNERVCQFRTNDRMKDIEIIEVDSLCNENRSGFGSSGTK